MKRIFASVFAVVVIGLFFGSAMGCVGRQPKPEAKEPTPPPPPPEKAIKRQIKDTDFRAKLEERGPKKRLAILPFVDIGAERSEQVREKAREAFMNDLNKTEELIALDFSQLKLDVTKYYSAGEYDLAKLAKDGQNSGVSALVEGKIIDLRVKKEGEQPGVAKPTKANFEAVVRVRVTSVRSGKELFHTVKTVMIEEENTKVAERVSSELFFAKNPDLVAILLKDAFLDFTPQIVESMNVITWEGRIAALKGEKVYLNVGKISGVQIGDILKVVEDGSEIYDPEIGYHIGKVSGKAKGTVEIVSYFGQDGAVGVIHSGAGFKENDRVELYH